MPGQVRRNTGQELGQPQEFLVRIVKARDQQRYYFEPEPHLVNPSNAVEDGPQPAAEFMITAVIETLEIYFIKVDPRPDIFQDLGGGVTVRDKAREEVGSMSFLEDGHSPFGRNQRFVISADHG